MLKNKKNARRRRKTVIIAKYKGKGGTDICSKKKNKVGKKIDKEKYWEREIGYNCVRKDDYKKKSDSGFSLGLRQNVEKTGK